MKPNNVDYNAPKKNSTAKIGNNLLTKEECPLCHFIFTSGFNPDDKLECPSCKHKFIKNTNKYNGTNNVYYKDGCPAIMSDGRFITYYNPSKELTDMMQRLNNIENPHNFRIFMQNNGNLFMDAERNYFQEKNTCAPNTACSKGWQDYLDNKKVSN